MWMDADRWFNKTLKAFTLAVKGFIMLHYMDFVAAFACQCEVRVKCYSTCCHAKPYPGCRRVQCHSIRPFPPTPISVQGGFPTHVQADATSVGWRKAWARLHQAHRVPVLRLQGRRRPVHGACVTT